MMPSIEFKQPSFAEGTTLDRAQEAKSKVTKDGHAEKRPNRAAKPGLASASLVVDLHCLKLKAAGGSSTGTRRLTNG